MLTTIHGALSITYAQFAATSNRAKMRDFINSHNNAEFVGVTIEGVFEFYASEFAAEHIALHGWDLVRANESVSKPRWKAKRNRDVRIG